MRKNSALAERIRETAFFLWEQDGRPDGRTDTLSISDSALTW